METRKKPFTEFEKSLIIKLIQQHADIVENKKIDSVTVQRKQAAWAKIAEQYNASARITEKINIKQLKKCWNNLKMKSKETKTNESQRSLPGGGPEHPLVNLGNIIPVIKVEDRDSDAIEAQEEEDYSEYYGHIKSQKEITEDANIEPPTPARGPAEELEVAVDPLVPEDPRLTEGPNVKSFPSSNLTTRCRIPKARNTSEQQTAENLKIKMMKQDFNNRALKFKIELDHLKKIQDYEIKIKQKELEHKSRMFTLYEEEMKVKIEILKNKKFND